MYIYMYMWYVCVGGGGECVCVCVCALCSYICVFYTIVCIQLSAFMHTILIVSWQCTIVCDLSDERPKEEKLNFKEVKEQWANEQVTKEQKVGEEEEEWSEDILGNRRKSRWRGRGGSKRWGEEVLIGVSWRWAEEEAGKGELCTGINLVCVSLSVCVCVCVCMRDYAYVVCMYEQVCMCVHGVCLWRPWPLLAIAGHRPVPGACKGSVDCLKKLEI